MAAPWIEKLQSLQFSVVTGGCDEDDGRYGSTGCDWFVCFSILTRHLVDSGEMFVEWKGAFGRPHCEFRSQMFDLISQLDILVQQARMFEPTVV